MLYDIFDQSMLLDFLGKVIDLIDHNQSAQLSNCIGFNRGEILDDLTEISGILYKFLSETLCRTIDYKYPKENKDSNPHLEKLKEMIKNAEENQNNWNIHTNL